MNTIDNWGSYITKGPKYNVLYASGPIFTPSIHRQALANSEGCVRYVDCHFNSSVHLTANYCFAILFKNTLVEQSSIFASKFMNKVSSEFGIRKNPNQIGGAGSGNISKLFCPAFLAEPGFLSNKIYYDELVKFGGLKKLGRLLGETIVEDCPTGGLIALSNSHKGRLKHDPGAIAPKVNDPDPAFDEEIELVEEYIKHATDYLISVQ